MKHLKNFNKINESAPIDDVQFKFEKTPEYKDAYKKMQNIVSELEEQFYQWCENNGHPGAEGDNDYDMTFDNILRELISRY